MSLKKIEQAIEEMKAMSDDFGALFLSGDVSHDKMITIVKGNPEVISASFGIKMNQSQDFNRIMMSMFASYLNDNPTQKAAFMSGLELVNNLPGVN